jgi:hypothetical protein
MIEDINHFQTKRAALDIETKTASSSEHKNSVALTSIASSLIDISERLFLILGNMK